MKNSKQLVSHLRSQSAFKPLSSLSCINAVKELLPPRLHRFILFGYIKNNILFFALNHPGAKQEFDNIISSIKTPLKQMPPFECKEFSFYDVRAFVSYKKTFTPDSIDDHIEHYEERSSGTFENTIKDEKLNKMFENIRKTIKDSDE